MKTNFAQQIRDKIETAKEGQIFIHADFANIAGNETVRKNLSRLVENGTIRRILNGIYEKPKYSFLLKEHVAADPHAVAEAIARNYHWTIAPSGNTALNLLNLSTQVPSSWSYISDGPYKTYEFNSIKIEFRHRTNKDISKLSFKTQLVIQALKALGKTNISDNTIKILSANLSHDEKKTMLWEAKESTDWIYDIIRTISKGETMNAEHSPSTKQ